MQEILVAILLLRLLILKIKKQTIFQFKSIYYLKLNLLNNFLFKSDSMTKKIIIIGGGIAGLSTGIYAQMNGYSATIFEKHSKPGGLCTSWHRKDFTFDYCIHNLAGTGNVRLRGVWNDLGAFEGTEIINHEAFTRVEDSHGNALNIYTDLDD